MDQLESATVIFVHMLTGMDCICITKAGTTSLFACLFWVSVQGAGIKFFMIWQSPTLKITSPLERLTSPSHFDPLSSVCWQHLLLSRIRSHWHDFRAFLAVAQPLWNGLSEKIKKSPAYCSSRTMLDCTLEMLCVDPLFSLHGAVNTLFSV